MIANLWGLMEGRENDCALLAASELLHKLSIHSFSLIRTPLCLYGNPAYPLPIHLQSPFKGAVITNNEKLFNKSMSKVRVGVEWVFAYITNYFCFHGSSKKTLKLV